jgi:hydrogenase maturation factor
VVKDVCLAYLPEIAVGDYTIVVTGFEPLDLLKRIRRTVRQLEEGRGPLGEQLPRIC